MSLKGIDISVFQDWNWKSIIDTYAKDFVICRAAFNFKVDQTCDKYYQYAKQKGLERGVYFFPLNANSTPEESAEWCFNQVKGYLNDAIIFLDYETYRENGVLYNDVSNTEWAYRWLEHFRKLSGIKPVIYLNTSTVNAYDWSKIANADYGLWLADYGNNNGQDHGVPVLKWWKFAMAHQYTSRALVPQGLDADIFFGDRAAWRKYANASATPEPAPQPTPQPQPSKKSIDELAKECIAGNWGNGYERKTRLKKAGYDYEAVQARVNELLGANKQYYVVQSGDNLSSIAAKFGTTWQAIYEKNKGIIGNNPNVIKPGQRLEI